MLKPFSRESEIRKKEKLQEKNQRKRRKIIRASFEPLLPGLIRMVYWGMIVLPFCSVAVELIACLGHKNDGTWELFWKNSGYSYFFSWLFLGVVTAALCVIQIVRTEKFGYSERFIGLQMKSHMQNCPSIRKRIIRRGKRTLIWPL